MNKRFYKDLLFKEEILEEKFIFVQGKIKTQKKNSILVLEESESIWGLSEKKDEENLVMDKSSYKTHNLEFTSLDLHIKETMEIQTQGQIGDVMET